jgi:Asp-tRNA(Asn)/Glu-tRNA(Gln) amidotransferase B subunit
VALNLGKSVVDFLTAHPEEKLSARQIAEWLAATFPDECNAKKASRQALQTDAGLLQQLLSEIRAMKHSIAWARMRSGRGSGGSRSGRIVRRRRRLTARAKRGREGLGGAGEAVRALHGERSEPMQRR